MKKSHQNSQKQLCFKDLNTFLLLWLQNVQLIKWLHWRPNTKVLFTPTFIKQTPFCCWHHSGCRSLHKIPTTNTGFVPKQQRGERGAAAEQLQIHLPAIQNPGSTDIFKTIFSFLSVNTGENVQVLLTDTSVLCPRVLNN